MIKKYEITVNKIPTINENKTIKENVELASSCLFSPIRIETIAPPPVAIIIPNPQTRLIIGSTIFILARASEPTNVDTKMPSIIVYKDINIMDIIAGETNFRNSKVVNFLVNKILPPFITLYL
ncbi:hypothetical protein BN173_1500021 [Clostridioides difficile T11]|nr:hypothetical protein BN173_1500021 [Clostridioides difficile T11]CCL29652.1 hypothetical protein BN174_1430012 [Clostridioides difficile E15]